ncbi:MAG: RQC domain protein, partial [Thermovenabulum sp.]
NARFIPLLKEWKRIEYKKVQAELQKAIDYLMKEGKI